MKYTMTCCVLFFAFLVHAQTPTQTPTQTPMSEWHVGIKTDLNFSTIKGNGMATSYTTGAQFGVFAEKLFNKKWSIQPELLFTQTNGKKADNFTTFYNTDGNVFASDNIKLGYISIPVMIKYNVNKYLSLLAGPQYGIMLFDAESLVDDDKGVAFKRYEISANAGLQFAIGSVAIYGRYNLGLSNINDIDNRYKWNSRHIQAGVAIRIK